MGTTDSGEILNKIKTKITEATEQIGQHVHLHQKLLQIERYIYQNKNIDKYWEAFTPQSEQVHPRFFSETHRLVSNSHPT